MAISSSILALVCAGMILYRIYKYMFYRPENFPPGPPRIPFFGSYLVFLLANYRHMHKAADWLCRYYKTNVLGFYFADKLAIVANDAESVKEALFNMDMDGKPKMMLAKMRDPNLNFRGIFFVDGQFWKQQRRYTLRHLRDYGFGRRFDELESDTNEEMLQMIDIIKNGPKYKHEQAYCKDGAVMLPQAFMMVPANSFNKVLFNERLPRDEQDQLMYLGGEILNFQRNACLWGRLFSVVEMIGKLFPEMSDFRKIKESADNMYSYMTKVVDQHYKTFDPDHERSVLDLYFQEMKNAEENNEDTFFLYDQLIMTCIDYSIPPISAIPITIAFLMQRLILQPEYQIKMQKEIDEVVGNGRLPTLDDRIKLPYTESCLREIMRLETLVPSGLAHRTLEDTKFMGYDVPADTIILPSLFALHGDKSKWGDPHLFRPERFLDDNGLLSLKKDYSLPFGAGKRLCAGETFARNTAFLMVASLMQNFTVHAPDNNLDAIPREGKTGLVASLPEFWVQFDSR